MIAIIVAGIAVGFTILTGANNNNLLHIPNNSSSSFSSSSQPASTLSSRSDSSGSPGSTSTFSSTTSITSSSTSSGSSEITTKSYSTSTSFSSSLSFSSSASTSSSTSTSTSASTTTLTSGSDYSIKQSNSTFRAGYEAFPYSYGAYLVREVSASWIVPRASCNGVPSGQAQYSYAWIGIEDGYNLEQTGTATDCNGSNPNYFAWYDFFPASIAVLSSGIYPGDVMKASVSTLSYPTYTLTITDQTQGWTKSVSGSGGQDWQADFVVEAPDHAQYPLTNFGTVTFSSCSMTIYYNRNGYTITGSILDHDYVSQLTMVSDTSSRIMATPSSLSSNGTSFTVTWENSQ